MSGGRGKWGRGGRAKSEEGGTEGGGYTVDWASLGRLFLDPLGGSLPVLLVALCNSPVCCGLPIMLPIKDTTFQTQLPPILFVFHCIFLLRFASAHTGPHRTQVTNAFAHFYDAELCSLRYIHRYPFHLQYLKGVGEMLQRTPSGGDPCAVTWLARTHNYINFALH